MKLKKCPFCGQREVRIMFNEMELHQVLCDFCGSRGPASVIKNRAVIWWNSQLKQRGKAQ